MLNKELMIKRLALIKQLYNIGLEQSKKVEVIASFSILSFHDSIEMFLKLISEHHNIKTDKFSFSEYWTAIPSLTLKESMANLNARRVNIKHKGLLPSKADIEISRVNTIDFFEQNVIVQCGIEFKNVSLLSLINYENVRLHLEQAQKSLESDKIEDCIVNTAVAFSELLDTYENNKSNQFSSSPFFFGSSFTFNSAFFMNVKDRKMAEFVDKVKNSIEGIQGAIKILSFGIDYTKYLKFKMLTPNITRMNNQNHVAEVWGKKKWTLDNCQYCIDFVLDSALKLQEFDFDINEIEEVEELVLYSHTIEGALRTNTIQDNSGK